MVALAELCVSDSSSGDKNEEVVLAKYIETSGTEWGKGAVQKNNEKWESQATTQKTKQTEGRKAPIKSFAAVATRDQKIYHITVSHDFFESAPQKSEPFEKWQVRVVEGTVTNGSDGKKEIKLGSSIISVSTENGKLEKLKTEPAEPTPSDGFAFVTHENNILFVMKGKAKSNDQNVTAVFQLESNTAGKTIKLLHVENIVSCYPSFFEWGKKLFMTPTLCPDKDSHNVKMFDKTNTFNDSSESIARLRDFFKNKKHFATTFINEVKKNVLLFTQQTSVAGAKQNVYMWMSDGTRVSNAGTILGTAIDADNTFYGSILHTNKELFALHQTCKTGSCPPKENIFSLTRLTDQLNKIKTTLKAWNENDEKIKDFYKEIDPKTNSWLTDGLVGFLSATKEGRDKEWTNVYHNFDTITIHADGEQKQIIDNGFKFSGEGAGAKWQVSKASEVQPYNFTDPGFTLVATVKIDGTVEGNAPNSVLGVAVKQLPVSATANNIGLLCSTENKWTVYTTKETFLVKRSTECEQGKTYSVALVVRNEKLEIYVDGTKLTLSKEVAINKKDKIDHFYFGANSDTPELQKTAVTITNVLLYNRPLKAEEEIKQLKPEQIKAGVQAQSGGDNTEKETPKETIDKTGTQPETSVTQTTTEKEDKQSSSPPPTTEDSAVRVCVVGVLCFMLFGVFTLLGRYVY